MTFGSVDRWPGGGCARHVVSGDGCIDRRARSVDRRAGADLPGHASRAGACERPFVVPPAATAPANVDHGPECAWQHDKLSAEERLARTAPRHLGYRGTLHVHVNTTSRSDLGARPSWQVDAEGWRDAHPGSCITNLTLGSAVYSGMPALAGPGDIGRDARSGSAPRHFPRSGRGAGVVFANDDTARSEALAARQLEQHRVRAKRGARASSERGCNACGVLRGGEVFAGGVSAGGGAGGRGGGAAGGGFGGVRGVVTPRRRRW